MDDEARTTLITQVATFGVFKLVTSILVIWFFPSWEAVLVVVGLSVPWIIAAVWFGGIYSHIRLRLVRVRLKRKELLRQEWHVD